MVTMINLECPHCEAPCTITSDNQSETSTCTVCEWNSTTTHFTTAVRRSDDAEPSGALPQTERILT